jgi:hypothetical protein
MKATSALRGAGSSATVADETVYAAGVATTHQASKYFVFLIQGDITSLGWQGNRRKPGEENGSGVVLSQADGQSDSRRVFFAEKAHGE